MVLILCYLALINIHLLNGSPFNPFGLYDLNKVSKYETHYFPNLHSNAKRIFFSDSWTPLGKPINKDAKNGDNSDFYKDNILYNIKKFNGVMPLKVDSSEINAITQTPRTKLFPQLFVSSGWGPAGGKRKRRLFLKSLFNTSDMENLDSDFSQIFGKGGDAAHTDQEGQEAIDKELTDIFNPIYRTIHLGGRSATDKRDSKREYKSTELPYIINIQGRRYRVGKSGLTAREIQAKFLASLAYYMQLARTRPDPYKRKHVMYDDYA